MLHAAQLRALERERCHLVGLLSTEAFLRCAKPILLVFSMSLLITVSVTLATVAAGCNSLVVAGSAFFALWTSSLMYIIPCLTTFRHVINTYVPQGSLFRFLLWLGVSFCFCYTAGILVDLVALKLFLEPIEDAIAHMSGSDVAEMLTRDVPHWVLREVVQKDSYKLIRDTFGGARTWGEFFRAFEAVARRDV